MEAENLRILGMFIGVLLRIGLPAIYIYFNTDGFEWDHKYTKQAILAVLISVVAVAIGYSPPEANLTGQQVFMGAIKDGALLEEVINQIRKWDEIRFEKKVHELNNGGTD